MQWPPYSGTLWDVPTGGQNLIATPDLSGASWTATRSTLTARGGTMGPNQQLKSARLIEDGTVTSTHFVQYSPSLTTTTAPCIARICARAISGSATRGLLLRVYNAGLTSYAEMYCKLRSGTQPVAAGVSGVDFTSAYARVIPHGNSWFEFVLVFVPANGITLVVAPGLLDSTLTTGSYSGDSASGIDLAEASVRVQ